MVSRPPETALIELSFCYPQLPGNFCPPLPLLVSALALALFGFSSVHGRFSCLLFDLNLAC
ncbi:uncharacterized protein BJX67DRAFT_367325 [Aspergillus lucknowensis]|uniref:Uncharacterized protein n=1 Tax=Aspergillus lucknowensis TaxID=176173 RepID=A0ABR4L9B0_9EURO